MTPEQTRVTRLILGTCCSYTNILAPRHVSQAACRATWLFECACERCGDPSELGLHYSQLQVTPA